MKFLPDPSEGDQEKQRCETKEEGFSYGTQQGSAGCCISLGHKGAQVPMEPVGLARCHRQRYTFASHVLATFVGTRGHSSFCSAGDGLRLQK